MGVARFQKSIDHAQRILAAAPGAKPKARRSKHVLENRFDHPLHRRLRHAVPDRRDTQRTQLAVRLLDLHPTHRQRPITTRFQLLPQLTQVPIQVARKPLHAHPIDTRRAAIDQYLLPGRSQRRRSVYLVDQTEPLASSDAVAQRRQHALRPDRTVDPAPILGPRRRHLLRSCDHCRSFACALVHPKLPASTFLSRFPTRGFC